VAPPLLQWTIIAFLLGALAVFLARLLKSKPGPSPALDFGAGFSAFLAGWAATELFGVIAPPEAMVLEELLHLTLLVLFACWVNLRFFWALRTAREGP